MSSEQPEICLQYKHHLLAHNFLFPLYWFFIFLPYNKCQIQTVRLKKVENHELKMWKEWKEVMFPLGGQILQI